MKISIIKCYQDNYSYVIHDSKSGIIIDACEAQPLFDFFKLNKIKPLAILTTHHHWDHVGGNRELCDTFQIPVYGNAHDSKIPSLSQKIFQSGETFILNGIEFKTLFAPGHTSHHVMYYFPRLKSLFTGDAFFSCGCGRLFEGTYQEHFESVQSVKKFHHDTNIYCGHEYSLKNTLFAKTVEPENGDIVLRLQKIQSTLPQPTIPTSLELELKINPFLRCNSPSIQKILQTTSDFDTFVALRKKRDSF